MYCFKCGVQNDDNAWKCVNCGEILQKNVPVQGQTVTTMQSGKAIASMICSIAGLFLCLFVGQIIGLILGYSARKEIFLSEGKLTGSGFATAGIVIGWIGIIIDLLLVIVWAVFLISFL